MFLSQNIIAIRSKRMVKKRVKHFQNGHAKIADKIDKLIREFEVKKF